MTINNPREAYELRRQSCIAKAELLLASLLNPVAQPDWGHAGSLGKVDGDLNEVLRFTAGATDY